MVSHLCSYSRACLSVSLEKLRSMDSQDRIYAICNTVSIKNVLMLMIYGNHDASIKVYDGGDNVLLATP